MSKRLLPKEKAFADAYIETGRITESVLRSYNTTEKTVASAMGTSLMKRQKILDYIESQSHDAASRIVKLATKARNENVRLNANKDILDRAGYKPVERTSTQTLNVNVDAHVAKSPELEALDKEYEAKVRELYARGQTN